MARWGFLPLQPPVCSSLPLGRSGASTRSSTAPPRASGPPPSGGAGREPGQPSARARPPPPLSCRGGPAKVPRGGGRPTALSPRLAEGSPPSATPSLAFRKCRSLCSLQVKGRASHPPPP